MPPSAVPPRQPSEIVMPDGCIIGVIFRALLAVNVVALGAILIRSSNIAAGLLEFVESSILIELARLSSLISLCGLRRAIRTIAPWGQRLACALVPAAVSALIIRFLSTLDLFHASLP